MNYVVVIGVGNFGYYVIKTLAEKGAKIVVLDKDPEKIELVKNFAAKAAIADSTNKETLESFGVKEADAVVVAVGPKLEDSILIVHNLMEIGVKKIIAKANSEEHGKILNIIGKKIDGNGIENQTVEVVFAERYAAIRVATKLISSNVLDFLPLSDEFSIREIAPPESFVGKSLRELDLRNKYNIHVIAVKEFIPSGEFDTKVILPKADFIIKDSDSLIVAGDEEALDKIPQI